jgi:protein gp37
LKLARWPLPNVWLGVSVEDQQRADERRQPMLDLAGAGWTTFVSYEPALGLVDWSGWEFLKWMISGGESGPRPTQPDWHRAGARFLRCAWHRLFLQAVGQP